MSVRRLLSIVVATVGMVSAQELEASFRASRGRVVGAAGEAFRSSPGAMELLRDRLLREGADRQLAIDHLQRMGAASAAAAGELLDVVAVPGEDGRLAAIAVGNVAPWWPERRRAEAQHVLAARGGRAGASLEAAALSRSWTRAGLAATRDHAAIEAMLRSGDPFQIEFGLHQLEGLEHEGKRFLPLLRELAAQSAWPVTDFVGGVRRQLPCSADWTQLIRDRIYWAVRRIEPADPLAVPFYLQRLPQAAPGLQFEFLQAFGRMGKPAATAVSAILDLSRSANALLAREAVTVLGMIECTEPAVVERLRELAAAPDVQLRRRAEAALRRLDRAR